MLSDDNHGRCAGDVRCGTKCSRFFTEKRFPEWYRGPPCIHRRGDGLQVPPVKGAGTASGRGLQGLSMGQTDTEVTLGVWRSAGKTTENARDKEKNNPLAHVLELCCWQLQCNPLFTVKLPLVNCEIATMSNRWHKRQQRSDIDAAFVQQRMERCAADMHQMKWQANTFKLVWIECHSEHPPPPPPPPPKKKKKKKENTLSNKIFVSPKLRFHML